MTLVIRKIDLPDEIEIEHDGGKFIFSRPSQLDLYDYDLTKQKGILQYAISKLKRIEDITFEDGSPYNVAGFVDLPIRFISEVAEKYAEAILPYFSQEVGIKKALEASAN